MHSMYELTNHIAQCEVSKTMISSYSQLIELP